MKIYIPLLGAKYHGGVRILFQIANKFAEKGYECNLVAPNFSWNPIYNTNKSVNY